MVTASGMSMSMLHKQHLYRQIPDCLRKAVELNSSTKPANICFVPGLLAQPSYILSVRISDCCFPDVGENCFGRPVRGHTGPWRCLTYGMWGTWWWGGGGGEWEGMLLNCVCLLEAGMKHYLEKLSFNMQYSLTRGASLTPASAIPLIRFEISSV